MNTIKYRAMLIKKGSVKFLNKNVVLITGCSSGFGKSLVALFLKNGWAVIASFRNSEKRMGLFAEEIKSHGDSMAILPLDVTQERDRENTFSFIKDRYGRLDCLVNNAGYGLFGSLEDASEKEFRDQVEVNLFGSAFLTKRLLPLLREAKGKALFVSSTFGFTGFSLSSAYCSSKFAIEGLAESLYYELRPHKVQVGIIEPGGFRTRFGQNTKWGSLSHDLKSPYYLQSENYKLFKQALGSRKGNDPAKVAKLIVKIAKQEKIRLRYRAGSDATSTYFLRKLLPETVFNALWNGICRNIFLREIKPRPGNYE